MHRFALKTLVAERGKLLTGLAGVVFSLVLVNVQGGLYFGLMRKASLLVDRCDADYWVTHRRIDNVDLAREIPESWGDRLRGAPGVESVRSFIVGKGTAAFSDGRMEDVWVIGADPRRMPIRLPPGERGFVEGSAEELVRPDSLSFDDVDAEKLGRPRVGDEVEVNGRRARFVARTSGFTGFITMPYLFGSLETARRTAHVSPNSCSYLLVTRTPDAKPDETLAALRRRVPEALVLTPPEFARMSQDYWMNRTGIGISFGASTVLGLFVGLMMVGQSLYALALDHLEDYATLKAIGAAGRHIAGVILVQSLSVAAGGSLAGVIVVLTIRRLWRSALAPIEIPVWLILSATAMVFVMCVAASLLPWARVRRIDPAIVLAG